MPVTGLPAALEVMLSTLLDSETMSSFKVFGERNATVVVLRFTSQVGQPSTVDRSTNCWRRKPPAQIRRDRRRRNRQRSTNFGNTGEPTPSRFSPSIAGHDSAERYSPLASLPAMPTTQFSTRLLDARENPVEMCAGGGSGVDISGIISECTASTAVTEPTARENRPVRASGQSDCATSASVSSACPPTQSDLCDSCKTADDILLLNEAASGSENSEVSGEFLQEFISKLNERSQARLQEQLDSISTFLHGPALSVSSSTVPTAAAPSDVPKTSKRAPDLPPHASVDRCVMREDQMAPPTVSKTEPTVSPEKNKQETKCTPPARTLRSARR